MTTTIIAGSRKITDKKLVYRILDSHHKNRSITKVVCGMATGVDTIGLEWANDRGIAVHEMPINLQEKSVKWSGHLRNQRMADYTATEKGACVVIWDGVSSGSNDMIKRAKRGRLHVTVYDLTQMGMLEFLL